MTLKELRIKNGLTQKEVADKIGITPNAVSNYEKGIRAISLEQVLKLAALYESTAEEVIQAQLNLIYICSTK